MPNLTLQMSNKYLYPVVLGAVDYIDLNYHEVQCLEMALYFLTSQVVATRPHHLFTALRKYHIDHLNDWLHNNMWRSELRFDAENSVQCPVESLDDAKWFALACEIGINEDTIISMAADEANYELDMAMMYDEKRSDEASYNDVFHNNYRAFHMHYCNIAKLKEKLAAKFRQILNA